MALSKKQLDEGKKNIVEVLRKDKFANLNSAWRDDSYLEMFTSQTMRDLKSGKAEVVQRIPMDQIDEFGFTWEYQEPVDLNSLDSEMMHKVETGEIGTKEIEKDGVKKVFAMVPKQEIVEHPYKVRKDEAFLELADSIRERGVLEPALVMEKENGRYMLLSGHRRKAASEAVNLMTLPCRIVKCTYEEAILLMGQSNLHRPKVLPSEKAFSYKLQLEAMKRQGKRLDLSSDPEGPKLHSRSNQELADRSEDGTTSIKRLIRLTELTPEMRDLVDQEKLAMRPAVELSYIGKEDQNRLYEVLKSMEEESGKWMAPTHLQTREMRRIYDREQTLSREELEEILYRPKPNQETKLQIREKEFDVYAPQYAEETVANKQQEILTALQFTQNIRDLLPDIEKTEQLLQYIGKAVKLYQQASRRLVERKSAKQEQPPEVVQQDSEEEPAL